MKAVLKWLNEIEEGVSAAGIHRYIISEITELGCTERTAKAYVDNLRDGHFIEEKSGYRFVVSASGKKWLKRHT